MEQLITENDNYQQGACENCGGLIMKVILMKHEITSLCCNHIHTYSKDKCVYIVTYKKINNV